MVSQFTDFEYMIQLVKTFLKRQDLSEDIRNRSNILLRLLEKCKYDQRHTLELMDFLRLNSDLGIGRYISNQVRPEIRQPMTYKVGKHISKLLKKQASYETQSELITPRDSSYQSLPAKQNHFSGSTDSFIFLTVFLVDLIKRKWDKRSKPNTT